MNASDRTYTPFSQVTVANGTRLYDRQPLDNVMGLSIQYFMSGGAAASVRGTAMNVDPFTVPAGFDATQASGGNVWYTNTIAANVSSSFNWTIFGSSQLASKWNLFEFNFTAPGTFTCVINLRRFQIP